MLKTVSFQAEKDLVRAFYAGLDAAQDADTMKAVMEHYTAPDMTWLGYHPFHELAGGEAVVDRFWAPLKQAIRPLQRRQDIFMSGLNEIDGFQSTWVVSMGHLMGLFDRPWLGIRPTGKIVMLRYCEFLKVEGDKITEIAMYFDIPHLMAQAGQDPFPPQTGAFLVQPGPMTSDGLLFDAQPPEEGEATLAAINHMINDLKVWNDAREVPIEEELRRSWVEDMLWWGPHGIGATYTIPRYAVQHSGTFRACFKERTYNGHLCRMAEGAYGGFFGRPNLTLLHAGGFMGMPGTGQWGDMRVIDIYRREGDKLAENWIFIDLLHFWNQQGVDILARATGIESPEF